MIIRIILTIIILVIFFISICAENKQKDLNNKLDDIIEGKEIDDECLSNVRYIINNKNVNYNLIDEINLNNDGTVFLILKNNESKINIDFKKTYFEYNILKNGNIKYFFNQKYNKSNVKKLINFIKNI